MRLAYSKSHPNQTELDSLPRLPLTLNLNNSSVEVVGLVDSGATINVLPFSVGQQLGATWDSQKAVIRLAGNMANSFAQPIVLKTKIGEFPLVNLAFAWVSHDNVPVILGQTNFFNEFEICFFRNSFEFEVKPKK
jgi:Aspartyl protease